MAWCAVLCCAVLCCAVLCCAVMSYSTLLFVLSSPDPSNPLLILFFCVIRSAGRIIYSALVRTAQQMTVLGTTPTPGPTMVSEARSGMDLMTITASPSL